MVIFRHQSTTIKCEKVNNTYQYPITNVIPFNYGYTCEVSELMDFFKDYKIKVSKPAKVLLNKGYFTEGLFIKFLEVHGVKDLKGLSKSLTDAEIRSKLSLERLRDSPSTLETSKELILSLFVLYGKALSEGKDLDFILSILSRLEPKIHGSYKEFQETLEVIWLSNLDWYENPHQVVKKALESFEKLN